MSTNDVPPQDALRPSRFTLETMQVVNWGGFEGHHEIRFTDQTMITGDSGAGKSSLLDGWLALFGGPNTAFNGASNDARTGRARSASQRSLLTYLRGKLDDSADEDDTPLTLRGQQEATWGALAATFVDENTGKHFTAARVYYVKPSATMDSEVVMKPCVANSALDLRKLEPAAQSKFTATSIKACFAPHDVEVFGTMKEYDGRLEAALGVNAAAWRLLARIQSGKQFPSIDALYKELILEKPRTFEKADSAYNEFEHVLSVYHEMETAQQKHTLLRDIPDVYKEWQDAEADDTIITSLGVATPPEAGVTPYKLWCSQTEYALLDEAEIEAGHNTARLEQEVTNLAVARDRSEEQLEEIKNAIRANGGEQLDQLRSKKSRLGSEHALQKQRRDTLASTISGALDVSLDQETHYRDVDSEARAFLESYDARRDDLKQQANDAGAATHKSTNDLNDLKDEIESLQGRDSAVSRDMDERRNQLAQAANINPKDLPYLAELVDVAATEEGWRNAIEVTLNGPAKVLLIDQRDLQRFSEAIDALQLKGRVHFEGVPVNVPDSNNFDSRRIAGKLVFKESPFSGWVQQRVSADDVNALCVETATELAGNDLRVTRAGQTRRRSKGAHGQLRQSRMLGFTNTARIVELEQQFQQLDKDAEPLRQAYADAQDALRKHDDLKNAYTHIVTTPWEDIDVTSTETAIEETAADIIALEQGNTVLQSLEQQRKTQEKDLETKRKDHTLRENEYEVSNDKWGKLAKLKDKVADVLSDVNRDYPDVTVTADQEQFLNDQQQASGHTLNSWDTFKKVRQKLTDHLVDMQDDQQNQIEKSKRELQNTFRSFIREFGAQPNLDDTPESYDGYLLILDDINTRGLHELRAEWRERLERWTGEHLVGLVAAMKHAVTDITKKLDAINDVLVDLPYGAHGDSRIRIDMKHHPDAKTKRFVTTLNKMASIDMAVTEANAESRFSTLQTFMGLISPHATGVNPRDNFLDVRRHLTISAVRLDSTGKELARYTSIAGKSGGESQELNAFLSSSALIFRLLGPGEHPETRDDGTIIGPAFRTVIVDEGFIKASGHFARRGVSAWRKLGFQLIIAAPLDKFTGLEADMSRILQVTKNPQQHSAVSILDPLNDMGDDGENT
jgi:uncharacterized protein YPO0396